MSEIILPFALPDGPALSGAAIKERPEDFRVEEVPAYMPSGRGEHLFTAPHHDAQLVEDMLGPLPLAGAFCAGELGPITGRNHVHAFTASVVVFGP